MHDINNSENEFSDSSDGYNRENRDNSTWNCSKCGKEFFQICSLQCHDHFYCDNNSWICDFNSCEKRFNLQEYLDIHKRVHLMGDMDKEEEVVSIFQPLKCTRSTQKDFIKRSKKNSSIVTTVGPLPTSSSLSAYYTSVNSSNDSSRRRCSPPLSSMPLELDDEEHEILFAPVYKYEGGQVDLYVHDFQYDLPAPHLPLFPSTTLTTTTTSCSSIIAKGILKRPLPSPYSNSCRLDTIPTSQPPTSKRQCRRRTVTFAENVYVLSFRSHESICPPTQIARAEVNRKMKN